MDNDNKVVEVEFGTAMTNQNIGIKVHMDTMGELDELIENHRRLIREMHANLQKIREKAPRLNIEIK